MNRRSAALALVHDPVLDRRGDVVTSAVTNLDLHDIARTSRTYGLKSFYVVTPLQEQRKLVERILGHWEGYGRTYNPIRSEALQMVRTVDSLDEAISHRRKEAGEDPLPVLTGAGRKDGISFGQCRSLSNEYPLLLVFGTGWGLAPSVFERGWPVLEPVKGAGDYNHLPVRAAAAIVLDRLFGRD